MSIAEQIREAEAELKLTTATENFRRAAEAAYVVARLYRDAGKPDVSKQYAKQSIALFEQSNIHTLEDAAPRYNSLGGILLPNLVHEGIVRNTFPEYQL